MERAATDLAKFPDDRLFDEISQGISHIITNADELNEAALRLHQADQTRTSYIIRGMAEEEAAKVLILIDATRGPRERRHGILKLFYNHLAKLVYAATSTYPSIWTFGEFSDFVDHQRRWYFLDGPNDVDWIVKNDVINAREQTIYVDFVRDITEPKGEYFWAVPPDSSVYPYSYEYDTPDVLTLSRALSDVGATSPAGLAMIADVWNGFTPSPDTDRRLLRELIERTLNRLIQRSLASGSQDSISFILSHWSFPLWQLDLSFVNEDSLSIEELRERRRAMINRLQATSAQRNPPPAITRQTVEAMSEAYTTWRDDAKEYDYKMFPHRHGPGLHFRDASEYVGQYRLPSYARLKAKLRALDTNKRIALLALSYFAKDRIPNWPSAFKIATDGIDHLDDDYQLGYGNLWLPGLDRWEAPAPPFRPGSFVASRLDRLVAHPL